MTTRRMTSPRTVRLRSLALTLALLTASGCSLLFRPAAPAPRFYVLTAVAQPGEIPAGRRLAFGLGPISLPPYLDRPEMVTRVAPNQLTFDEFNRWSEPLKSNLVHALATDLDTLIGFDLLALYPWYRTTQLDYSAAVVVLRFEPQPSGDAALDARWSISDGHDQILVNRESHFTRPTSSPAATAQALSEMVAAMARDIAAAVRDLDATRVR